MEIETIKRANNNNGNDKIKLIKNIAIKIVIISMNAVLCKNMKHIINKNIKRNNNKIMFTNIGKIIVALLIITVVVAIA